jgi:trehalose-6-phosphate synthase
MDALMDVEGRYKNVGKALLGKLFHGSLHPAEQNWWDGFDKERSDQYEDDRRKKRPNSFSIK